MAKLDFNKSPYFDDFETVKGNNYRRILFRPSFAVQARELTQLQTNLQEQLKDITNATLDSGNQLVPGELTVLTDVQHIVLAENTTSSSFYNEYHTDSTLDDGNYIVGMDIQNVDGTKVGKIILTRPPTTNESGVSLYVVSKSGDKFVDGDSLYSATSSVDQTTLIAAANSPTGVKKSALAYIGAGTYYINGFALEVTSQVIKIEDYASVMLYNHQLGLTVAESIVDELTDKELLDPALGKENANVSAAGATRYKLAVTLSSKKFNKKLDIATDNEGFIELARVIEGKVQNKVSYQDSIASKEYVQGITSQTESPFDISVVDDIDGSVKLKVTSGSKIIDGKKVTVRQANEFTLTGSESSVDTTGNLMDGATASLWGGSSAHAESGLRVVTKNGLKWGTGSSWSHFAPNNQTTVENSRVLLTKKVGSDYIPIGDARIENITLSENITKIRLAGGDIAQYSDITPGEFLVQPYNSATTAGFKAKFLSAIVDDGGNVVLNVQVYSGSLNPGANLLKETDENVIAVSSTNMTAIAPSTAMHENYTWIPTQTEFEVGLNDINFDEIELTTLTIKGTHGATGSNPPSDPPDIIGLGISNTTEVLEGTVVGTPTATTIVVKNTTGKFIPTANKFYLNGTDVGGVDVTAVSYEAPVKPYTISDVTHLVKYASFDTKKDSELTGSTGDEKVICELDTTRTVLDTAVANELYPLVSAIDRKKTNYLGEFSNPRLYEMGKSVQSINSTFSSISKIRKTFTPSLDTVASTLTVNLDSGYKFDIDEPVLVYRTSALSSGGFFETSQYRYGFSAGDSTLEIKAIDADILLPALSSVVGESTTANPTGITTTQKKVDKASIASTNAYYVVASVTKTGLARGVKSVSSWHEYITDQLLVKTGNITLAKTDVIPHNFKVYEIAGDTTLNTTWPDQTPSETDLVTAGFDVTDRYVVESGQDDSYYRKGVLKLKDGEENPSGPIWIAYYYFFLYGGDFYDIGSYEIGESIAQTAHFPSTVVWKSKKDGSTIFNVDDIPVYKATNGKSYRLGDVIDLRSENNGLVSLTDYPLVSFGGEVKSTNVTTYSAKNNTLSLESDGTVKLLEGPKDSNVQDFLLAEVDDSKQERLSDGTKLADIKIDGYLYDKGSVVVNPTKKSVSSGDIILSDDVDPVHVFRDPLTGDVEHDEYSVAKDGDEIRPSFTKKHITFDKSAIQTVDDTIYAGSSSVHEATKNLVTFLADGSNSTYVEIENSNTNGNIPIRYSEPNVYQGIMQITPSQFAGKSNRKYIGNEWNSWKKEVDDTIASKVIVVTVDGLKPNCTKIKVNFDGKDVSTSASALSSIDSSYTSYVDTDTLKSDTSGTLKFKYRIPNINDGYVTLKMDGSITGVVVGDTVKQKVLHHEFEQSATTGFGTIDNVGMSNDHIVSSGKVEFIREDLTGSYTYIGLSNVIGDFKPTRNSNANATDSDLLREDGTTLAGIIVSHAEGSSFPCGSKLITISSDDESINAEGYFYGTDTVSTKLSTRNLDHNAPEQKENSLFQIIDILDDCFAQSIDLGFDAIHSVSSGISTIAVPNVIVQIREIINGVPSDKSLPFSTIAKSVTAVTDATKDSWENFVFNDYVYLKKGKYAISISSSSSEYTLQTLNVDSGAGTRPLAIGRLYQGNYMNPSDILRFRLQRANFDIAPGNNHAILESSGSLSWGGGSNSLLLLEDSISANLHESLLTIKIPGHGFKAGDTFKLSGLVGRKETVYTLTGAYTNLADEMSGTVVYSQSINTSSPGARTLADIKGPHGYAIAYDSINDILTVAMVYGEFRASSVLAFLGKDGATVGDDRVQGTVSNISTGSERYVSGINITELNGATFTVSSITANTIVVNTPTTSLVSRRSGFAKGTYGATLENISDNSPAYKNDLYSIRAGIITPGNTRVSWKLGNITTGATVYPNRLIKSQGFSRYDEDVKLIPSLVGVSSDHSISPVIDKEMVDVLAISNIIDSTGTSANYISKSIKTDSSANSLEVILDSFLPGGTSLNVYCKLSSANSTISDSWKELKPVGNLKMGTAENKFIGKELGDFTTYQIKVSLKASDSSNVPTIKNLRYISSLQGITTKTLKTASIKLKLPCYYFTTSSHSTLGIPTYTAVSEFGGLVRDSAFIDKWYEIDVPVDFDVEDAEAIIDQVNDKFTIGAVASDEGPITGTITITNDNTGGGSNSGGWATGTTFTVTPPTSRGTWRSPATFTIATVDGDNNVASVTITSAGDGFIANETAKWANTHSGYTQNVIGDNAAASSESVIALASGSLATDSFDNEAYPRFTINTVNAAAHDVVGITDEPAPTHVAEARIKRLTDGSIFPSRIGKGAVLQVRLVKNAHIHGLRTRTVTSYSGTATTGNVYPSADVYTLVVLKGR